MLSGGEYECFLMVSMDAFWWCEYGCFLMVSMDAF